MDVDCTTTKCTRFANASKDRLSSLPDHILIPIISHLPFPYVVITECLSSRWRGLWTQLTSIDINRLEHITSLEFITNTHHLLSRITSPCINSFNVRLYDLSFFTVDPLTSIDSWIESLINNHNNVRELKVILPFDLVISVPVVQRFILQTQTSLVSLELNRLISEQSSSDVDFNLPNLRSLILGFDYTKDSEWLNKLIKGCPLLEYLDLSCQECTKSGRYVIHAPKLKYLSVHGNYASIFCFSEIPIALRHVRVQILNFFGWPSDVQRRLWSTFYKGISNATVLHFDLNVFPTLHLSTTLFQRASQLTLDLDIHNIQTVLSFLEFCPVINYLTLRFYPTYRDKAESEPPKPDTLQSTLQRIHVEIYLDPYHSKHSFEVVIEYLLSNTINLAHFEFDLTNSKNWRSDSDEAQQRKELELCKRLYNCPVASTMCKIKFVGIFYKKFQKAGPNAWIDN